MDNQQCIQALQTYKGSLPLSAPLEGWRGFTDRHSSLSDMHSVSACSVFSSKHHMDTTDQSTDHDRLNWAYIKKTKGPLSFKSLLIWARKGDKKQEYQTI